MAKITSADLRTQLAQFTGADEWYYNPLYPGMKYTPGVRCLAEAAGAYWLLDIIGTEYHREQMRVDLPYFVAFKLKVADNEMDIDVEDGDRRVLKTRHIDYTDFPEGEWTLWLTDDVLLLPSEY